MSDEATERVEFIATFPPIQSAIKIDGSGGARIQLDIPEVEIGDFIKAMMWRQKRLVITIEPLTEFDDETKQGAETKTTRMGRRRLTKR